MTPDEQLKAHYRRQVEINGTHPYAQSYGCEWHDLTDAEEHVFGITLDHMPSFVALWMTYELVLDIADGFPPGDAPPDTLIEAVRDDHPWIRKAMDPPTETIENFQAFAKLMGVPFRLSHAFYYKRMYHDIRAGDVRFSDE